MSKPDALHMEFCKWTLPKRLWAEHLNGGEKLTAEDKALFYPIIEDIFREMPRAELHKWLLQLWDCEDLPARDRQKIRELLLL